MTRIHEDDLWVDRGRRPRTGVAKAKKTDRIQTGILALLVAGLIVLGLFIGIALIAQTLPQRAPASESAAPAGQEGPLPGENPGPEAPELTLALNRIEWAPAFQALAEAFGKEKNVKVKVTLISGYEDYPAALASLAAAQAFPDLFVVDGLAEASAWSQRLADLSGEPWASKTPFSLKDEKQRVIGFPVDLAAQGLIYNQSLLEQAGIDPAALTNRAAWETALQALDKQKKKLGILAPVALALHDGGQFSWSSSKNFLDIYLSSGLDYGNTQLIAQMQAGQVEPARLQQVSDYLDLLFRYSDQTLLLQGSCQEQLQAFAAGQTVFTVGSSDLDPSFRAAGISFAYGFLPYGAYLLDTNGIFAQSTDWLVLDQASPHRQLASDFLASLANQGVYQDLLAEKANVLPAFLENSPGIDQPLLRDLAGWMQAGRIYGLHQDQLPAELGATLWSPLLEQLATREISSRQFAERAATAIAEQAAIQ